MSEHTLRIYNLADGWAGCSCGRWEAHLSPGAGPSSDAARLKLLTERHEDHRAYALRREAGER